MSGLFCCCCCCCWAGASMTQTTNVAIICRILEPEPQAGIHSAHCRSRRRQPESARAQGGSPVCNGDVVERIRHVKPEIQILSLSQAERPSDRAIERKDHRPGDNIAARGSPLAGGRSTERQE